MKLNNKLYNFIQYPIINTSRQRKLNIPKTVDSHKDIPEDVSWMYAHKKGFKLMPIGYTWNKFANELQRYELISYISSPSLDIFTLILIDNGNKQDFIEPKKILDCTIDASKYDPMMSLRYSTIEFINKLNNSITVNSLKKL